MKGKLKVWLWAVVVGVLLPWLMFTVAEKMITERQGDIKETKPQLQTEQSAPKSRQDIAVMMEDGTVTQIDLDAYLVGVILAEMPASFDTEALKAQAVVARTYALKRHTTGQKHPHGAVCTNSACCQAYRSDTEYLSNGGLQQSVEKISDAVKSTMGQVLYYDGVLIEATYFSCSGGKTEDALAVWGTDIPYLKSLDSPGEELADHFLSTEKFSIEEFASLLEIDPEELIISRLGPVSYTTGGGVDTIEIAGKLFDGISVRQKLGLRSTAFNIVIVGKTVQVTTRGFGHRVGMSQYGAEAMAVKGSSYEEILAYYYPGTELVIYTQN